MIDFAHVTVSFFQLFGPAAHCHGLAQHGCTLSLLIFLACLSVLRAPIAAACSLTRHHRYPGRHRQAGRRLLGGPAVIATMFSALPPGFELIPVRHCTLGLAVLLRARKLCSEHVPQSISPGCAIAAILRKRHAARNWPPCDAEFHDATGVQFEQGCRVRARALRNHRTGRAGKSYTQSSAWPM